MFGSVTSSVLPTETYSGSEIVGSVIGLAGSLIGAVPVLVGLTELVVTGVKLVVDGVGAVIIGAGGETEPVVVGATKYARLWLAAYIG